MLQALLHLLSNEPQLLAAHAQAYGELAATEVDALATRWRRRVLWLLLALALVNVALTLAGMALLLWAATPPGQIGPAWLLWVVPLLPALAAAGCAVAAQGSQEARSGGAFRDLREQLQADWILLRDAGDPAP
jgi:hypothetical protein